MLEKQKRILGKFLSFNSKPTNETFRELPDALIWVRCVMALGYGYHLGAKQIQGAAFLLYGLNFISFVPMFYCLAFLQADGDSYGTKLFLSGLPNAMALVFLLWIYFYTVQHATEAEQLQLLLATIKPLDGATDGSIDDATRTLEGEGAAPIAEESEF